MMLVIIFEQIFLLYFDAGGRSLLIGDHLENCWLATSNSCKTYNMFLFLQSLLTERVSNNSQLRMRQFYFSGLLRRIDSHYGSKATKVSNYSRYIEGKIHFCLLFPFSYEQILYEPYEFQDFPYLRDIGSDGKVFCSFYSTTFSITNSD